MKKILLFAVSDSEAPGAQAAGHFQNVTDQLTGGSGTGTINTEM
jgi:hypothetical protein